MEEDGGKAFPGCKHTTDSAFSAIFSSVTSLVLIVHMIIMVRILNKYKKVLYSKLYDIKLWYKTDNCWIYVFKFGVL